MAADVTPAAARSRRIRDGAQWKRARALARRRDGNRCRLCGSTERLGVHHIVSLRDGGSERPPKSRHLVFALPRRAARGGRGSDAKSCLSTLGWVSAKQTHATAAVQSQQAQIDAGVEPYPRGTVAWASVRECHQVRRLRCSVRFDGPGLRERRQGAPADDAFQRLLTRVGQEIRTHHQGRGDRRPRRRGLASQDGNQRHGSDLPLAPRQPRCRSAPSLLPGTARATSAPPRVWVDAIDEVAGTES